MNRLTISEVNAICTQHDYIGLRETGGYLMAYNCKLINLYTLKQQLKENPTKESPYVSFRPLTFQEYISIKHPFIISTP